MREERDRRVNRLLALLCCVLTLLLAGQIVVDSGGVPLPDYLTEAPERLPDEQGILRIPLNSAPAEAFEEISGIGPSLAEAIVSYRDANGRFESIDELIEVKGIGPATLDKIRPYLSLD